jgi:hypothetical protein
MALPHAPTRNNIEAIAKNQNMFSIPERIKGALNFSVT